MELSMSVMESGIRSDFLNPSNYKTTLEFASKRDENYLKYCKVIQKYYLDLQGMTRIINQKVKTQTGNGLQTTNQFKQFLREFMATMDEVSKFKIQFYEELEEVEEDPAKNPTYEMLSKINKYSESQNNYKEIYRKLISCQKQLEETYAVLKKEIKEPANYFNNKFVTSKTSQLEKSIAEREQLQAEGNTVLETIYKNSEQFEKELMFYRQKMLCGKYKIHQKLREMSKGAKQCLVQTLLTLLEIVYEKRRAFHALQRQSIRESSLFQKFKRRPQGSSSDQQQLTEIIIQATQQYKIMIDELTVVLQILSESFLSVGIAAKETHQSSRSVIEELNRLYENDENPTPQIMEALDLFNYFCQKLADIPNRIHILEVNLSKLKQTIIKHSEITLTLVRCGNLTPVKGETKGIDQISHLFEQLSFDYINDIIQKLYQQFESTLGNMKNYFNAKFYKRRKNVIQDSMEVSHIEEQIQIIEKKPSKKQLWIWKDFRNASKYNKIGGQSALINEIQKELKNLKSLKCQNGKQIEKYNCNLKNKKGLKGVLTIYEKVFTFEAANNSFDLLTPYDFVEEVVAGVDIFQKELTVKTSMGNIIFLHFPEISRAELLIQQQIAAQSSNSQPIQKKSVELTPQQINFIKQRKPKIDKERASIQDMQEIGQLLLENATIDTVYETIYSDKPFKFKGKEQCCYMSYVLKKSGGLNYKTTPYTQPGPKFYSGQEGSTFISAPLYSQRTNQYEVLLPPIPFLPKTCMTTEQVKIYWLSNEELDYIFRVDSRGAPMADCFYLSFVHRIVQKQGNVEIKIYYKCTFVKDTMKGMITSKSEEQSKTNVGIFITQTKKIMKNLGGKGEKGQIKADRKQIEEAEEQDQSKSLNTGKVKKLQNQNKILIGVLVAVILLNFILRFF